jgi:hypothetical protein
MHDQLAREWICRPMSQEMSLITEKMVADAIKEGVSQQKAADRWNVKPKSLSKHTHRRKWGDNGVWPDAKVRRTNLAREFIAINGNNDDLTRTQAALAKTLKIHPLTLQSIVSSSGEPWVGAGRTPEYHAHIATLTQQLQDGTVRRVALRCHPAGLSIPSPSAAPYVAQLPLDADTWHFVSDGEGVEEARINVGSSRSALGGAVRLQHRVYAL